MGILLQKKALKNLADAFGEDILNPDGSLNRAVLAGKAFSSKENTELLNAVNAAIEEMIQDGTIDAIIEKYIPTETS